MSAALSSEGSSDRPDILTHAAKLMPWALSVLFHVGLLIVLLFWTMIRFEQPAKQTPDVEIRVNLGGSGQSAPKPTVSRPTPKPSLKPLSDVPVLTAAVAPPAPSAAPKSPSTSLAPPIDGPPGPPGPRRTIRFIVEDVPPPDRPQARRVVFVVDKSGSMFATFDYVKTHLINAIEGLTSKDEYHVIFFADGRPAELVLDGRTGLRPAMAPHKRATIQWIRGHIAQSRGDGTDPRQAMERAFNVAGGPPDVIFLLTDGEFSEETRLLIRRLNPGAKVRVHTVAVGREGGGENLRAIAADNAGQFRLVSLSELSEQP